MLHCFLGVSVKHKSTDTLEQFTRVSKTIQMLIHLSIQRVGMEAGQGVDHPTTGALVSLMHVKRTLEISQVVVRGKSPQDSGWIGFGIISSLQSCSVEKHE